MQAMLSLRWVFKLILNQYIRALMGLRVHEHQFENQYKLWIEKAKKYDFSRGTRMAAFRFFLLTPLENRWMIFAERKFTGRTLFNLTKKVSIDQFMVGPILRICFFTYNEGKFFTSLRYDVPWCRSGSFTHEPTDGAMPSEAGN